MRSDRFEFFLAGAAADRRVTARAFDFSRSSRIRARAALKPASQILQASGKTVDSLCPAGHTLKYLRPGNCWSREVTSNTPKSDLRHRNFGASRLAEKFGVKATPRLVSFRRCSGRCPARIRLLRRSRRHGRYAPWRSAASQEKIQSRSDSHD